MPELMNHFLKRRDLEGSPGEMWKTGTMIIDEKHLRFILLADMKFYIYY